MTETMLPILVVLAVQFTASVTSGQEIHFGSCPPTVETVKDLNVTRYLGEWYEIAKFFFGIELGEKCIRANYSLKDDGHIKVLNRAIKADGSEDIAIGDAYAPDPNVTSKLAVQFAAGTPRAPYWIVDTDYDTYSLIWSCTDFGILNFDFAWILSRKRTMSAAVESKLKDKLQGYGIKTSGFMQTDQTDC